LNNKPDISIVIPLLNEAESLPELHAWIVKVMEHHRFDYEILFIDDGSTDHSWDVICLLAKNNVYTGGCKFQRNYGKSAALNTGFGMVKGKVVITMDADLQDSPEEIPDLYKLIQHEGYDIVSGWKKKRYDPITKTLPTKLFNWATRKISGIELHDFNCGLKAYKLQVVKSIEIYGEMHRYIPVIANWAGFRKIGEKAVAHQARKYGTTKFGIERFVNGFLDLFSITFMSKFGKRPMHFFGFIGTIAFLIGFLLSLILIGEKVYSLFVLKFIPREVTDQPLFYLALTSMIIGTQLFLAGFIGELIARNSSIRNQYLLAEKIDIK
jgi:glycosyltransferase involved in cell wall biosynthesis